MVRVRAAESSVAALEQERDELEKGVQRARELCAEREAELERAAERQREAVGKAVAEAEAEAEARLKKSIEREVLAAQQETETRVRAAQLEPEA